MHIHRIALILVLGMASLLTGCSTVPSPNSALASSLAGCWYGENYQPVFGDKAGWLMNRREDGTFTIEFRTVKAGNRLPIQIEEGRWKYQDGRYATITTNIEGKTVDPPYVDVYEIKSLSENEMTYYHPDVKQTFSSRRVSCDYQAP